MFVFCCLLLFFAGSQAEICISCCLAAAVVFSCSANGVGIRFTITVDGEVVSSGTTEDVENVFHHRKSIKRCEAVWYFTSF